MGLKVIIFIYELLNPGILSVHINRIIPLLLLNLGPKIIFSMPVEINNLSYFNFC